MSPSPTAYLANPIYVALTTAEAPFSLKHGVARRFQPDSIPFAAVPNLSDGALQDLSGLLAPGEEIWITVEEDQTIPAVHDLQLVTTLPGLQMRFAGDPPLNNDEGVVQLTEADTESMLSLKQLAYPGFFGPRAPQLGTFFGIRDAATGQLVAMGGERLATDQDHEISAVCTHP